MLDSSPSTTSRAPDLQEIAYSQEGRILLNQTYIMLRTAQLYDSDNKNFRRQVELTASVIATCFEHFGELSLQLRSGYFFFCGVRIRENVADFTAVRHLKELFANLDISGFLFLAPPAKKQVTSLFMLLAKLAMVARDGKVDLESSLRHAGIDELEALPPYEEDPLDEDRERANRVFAKKTFFYMLDNLKLVTGNMSGERAARFTKTQRVIHAIVDQIVSEDSYLLELTALRSHDEYTYLHSTNVCIYAVSVGSRLGLNKSELSDLGFSALFHDVGKGRLPTEILNKIGSFTDEEWQRVKKHPIDGVLSIASTMPFDGTSCRAMLTAYEHHLNLDGTGYPSVQPGQRLSLYSKIVAICDVFDAMSSGRVYRKDPLSPQRSLQMMMLQVGEKFDPLLFKLFVNVVSVYPPGTVLLLDSGELAVATARNSDDLFRPKAMVIGSSAELYSEGVRINLMDRDPASGHYLRSVVKSIPPERLAVDLNRYLVQEI
jgi:HD-GYP domain-containing protein (c-di-GMP phosphodiesterase class II)